LRVGLRQTLTFQLRDYFINFSNFDLCIGPTYFSISTDLCQLVKLVDRSINGSKDLFIDPLMFVQMGNLYLDRSVLINCVESLNTVVENQTALINQLDRNLMNLENLFSKIATLLVSYYNQITFNY